MTWPPAHLPNASVHELPYLIEDAITAGDVPALCELLCAPLLPNYINASTSLRRQILLSHCISQHHNDGILSFVLLLLCGADVRARGRDGRLVEWECAEADDEHGMNDDERDARARFRAEIQRKKRVGAEYALTEEYSRRIARLAPQPLKSLKKHLDTIKNSSSTLSREPEPQARPPPQQQPLFRDDDGTPPPRADEAISSPPVPLAALPRSPPPTSTMDTSIPLPSRANIPAPAPLPPVKPIRSPAVTDPPKAPRPPRSTAATSPSRERVKAEPEEPTIASAFSVPTFGHLVSEAAEDRKPRPGPPVFAQPVALDVPSGPPTVVRFLRLPNWITGPLFSHWLTTRADVFASYSSDELIHLPRGSYPLVDRDSTTDALPHPTAIELRGVSREAGGDSARPDAARERVGGLPYAVVEYASMRDAERAVAEWGNAEFCGAGDRTTVAARLVQPKRMHNELHP